MEHYRRRVNRLDRFYGFDDSSCYLQHDSNITFFPALVRRPKPAHPSHQCRDYRFVQWRVPANKMTIAFGERGRIACYITRIIFITKPAREPVRTSVMHQVDDRSDVQVLNHVMNNFVDPLPLKLVRFGFDLVPWHTPADPLQSEFAAKSEILPPVTVMPHQLVLVERTMTIPRLWNEGVLDTGGPNKIARLMFFVVPRGGKSSHNRMPAVCCRN